MRAQPINLAGKAAAALDRGAIAGGSDRTDRPLRSWLRGAYEHVVFYGLLLVFGLSSLTWSLLAGILYWLLPRRLGEPLGQFMIMAGFRGFVAAMRAAASSPAISARSTRSRGAGPLVIAPNHPSLLDAVLVISRLPHVVCAAKAEIWDNLFLGGSARLAGFIRNDSPDEAGPRSRPAAARGRHLLIFPEGTRTSARPVGAFKGGFALIAKQAGAPVQTVFIESHLALSRQGLAAASSRQNFPCVYRVAAGAPRRRRGERARFRRRAAGAIISRSSAALISRIGSAAVASTPVGSDILLA